MTTLRTGPSGPLRGEARVPGDKSIAHRAIVLGALAEGRSLLTGFPSGEDNLRTAAALRAMGAAVALEGGLAVVDGVGLGGLHAAGAIDCGNSGTTMRLLAGVAATLAGRTMLDGDPSLRRRPMRRVAAPLAAMGARVRGRDDGGELLPPLEIDGGALHGVAWDLPIASAQVKSAILLAALSAAGPTRVREPARSRDHTERMLAAQGAPLRVRADGAITLDPAGWDRRLRPLECAIPGDLSSAAFALVAAALVPGSEVVACGVGLNPTRTGVLDTLCAMGADVAVAGVRDVAGEPVGDVRVRAARLRAVTIGGALALRSLDEIPILAVAATQAHGTTVVRDAAELRRKESDRLSAMARALARLGCRVDEVPDGLAIHGPCALAGGRFDPADVALDHRVAMSLAVAGLVARAPVEVLGAEAIATSFPGFAEGLAALGAPAVSDPAASPR